MSEDLIKSEFLKEFTIEENYFENTGLKWETLVEIYEDYLKLIPSLEKEMDIMVTSIRNTKKAHSIRRRVKEPKHLIEKIIRKAKKYLTMNISVDNYKEIITDLIGIRVLHLFKEDWRDIHTNINSLWKTKEIPQINIRRGDYNTEELRHSLKDLNCEVIVREHGYRSVHYLIQNKIKKGLNILIEIQVRTVFEEAWSEIDHMMRYPYGTENPIITEYLAIFNRIVGCADEMGTFLQKMKGDINKLENNNHQLANVKEIFEDFTINRD